MKAFPIIAFALACAIGAEAQAQTYNSCFEPAPPDCIDRYGTFDDEWSFNRCKRDVESYIDDVSMFRSCLANWHEAVGYEVDEVIERFNCKARGESYCR